jgi:hypothetical protein
MRAMMFIGATIGSLVGWWIGAYANIYVALLASAVGGIAGIWLTWRVLKDYL